MSIISIFLLISRHLSLHYLCSRFKFFSFLFTLFPASDTSAIQRSSYLYPPLSYIPRISPFLLSSAFFYSSFNELYHKPSFLVDVVVLSLLSSYLNRSLFWWFTLFLVLLMRRVTFVIEKTQMLLSLFQIFFPVLCTISLSPLYADVQLWWPRSYALWYVCLAPPFFYTFLMCSWFTVSYI